MPSLFTALAIGCGFLLGLRVGISLGRRSAQRELAGLKALKKPVPR